jgi:hypothetical protein
LSAVLCAYSDSYKNLKSDKVDRFMELFCDRLSKFSKRKISQEKFDTRFCMYLERMLGVNIIIMDDSCPKFGNERHFSGGCSKAIVLFYNRSTKRYHPLISKKQTMIVDMPKVRNKDEMLKAVMKIYRM